MTSALELLLALAAFLLLISAIVRRVRSSRLSAAGAGIAAGTAAIIGGAIWLALAGFTYAAIQVIQTVLHGRRRTMGFASAEEEALIARLVGLENPEHQRHLRDLIIWSDAEPGTVLMRQGEASPPLCYIARGTAAIEHQGQVVGGCTAGEFIGEMSLFSGEPASATVVVTEAARIARFEREALAEFLRALPELEHAMTTALNRGLVGKVKRMNEAAGEGVSAHAL